MVLEPFRPYPSDYITSKRGPFFRTFSDLLHGKGSGLLPPSEHTHPLPPSFIFSVVGPVFHSVTDSVNEGYLEISGLTDLRTPSLDDYTFILAPSLWSFRSRRSDSFELQGPPPFLKPNSSRSEGPPRPRGPL